MKKLVLGILLTVLASSVFAQDNERVLLSQMKLSDYSRWSVALGGGYDYYRVNPYSQNSSDGFWKYHFLGQGDWTFPQVSVEYSINPLFGIGVHFGRYGFNRSSGLYQNHSKGGKFVNYGAVYDLTIYASIDLTDALFPYRKGRWNNLSVYTDFGIGVGYYQGNMAEVYDAGINQNVDWPFKNENWPFKNLYKYGDVGQYNGTTPVYTSFLNAEYSFGRRIALGLGFGYRTYMRDGLGGYNQDAPTLTDWGGTHFRGNTEAQDDDGWNLTLSLRLKLGSSNKTHMRDVRLTDGYRILEERIQRGEDLLPEILNRLRDIEDAAKGLEGRLSGLETDLGKLHDTIYGARGGLGTPENPWIINGVNFVFDKTTIIEESMPILRSVLIKLIVHYSEWSELKIDGHTDVLGTDEYNKGLSLRRAEAVKKFFIDNGLGDKKFVIEGFGAQKPIAPNITPTGKDDPEGRQKNRRVELYVIK